jgi:hypothetical protein
MAHHPLNPLVPEGRANVYLDGGSLLQLVHSDPTVSRADMHWRFFSVRFRARSTTTTLTISDATGSPFAGGLALDGLSVTAVDSAPPPAATAAPAAPTGLAAQAISPTQVELRWQDNSAAETGFGIWRKSGTSDWQRVGVAAPSATRYEDRSVGSNTTYISRIRAHNNAGASAWSNEVRVTTPAR